MSQALLVGSSWKVYEGTLATIAQVQLRELLKLDWGALDKNFFIKSFRLFNLLKSAIGPFIFSLRLTFLGSVTSISQIAAIKSVHLPIAVERLWCFGL